MGPTTEAPCERTGFCGESFALEEFQVASKIMKVFALGEIDVGMLMKIAPHGSGTAFGCTDDQKVRGHDGPVVMVDELHKREDEVVCAPVLSFKDIGFFDQNI